MRLQRIKSNLAPDGKMPPCTAGTRHFSYSLGDFSFSSGDILSEKIFAIDKQTKLVWENIPQAEAGRVPAHNALCAGERGRGERTFFRAGEKGFWFSRASLVCLIHILTFGKLAFIIGNINAIGFKND